MYQFIFWWTFELFPIWGHYEYRCYEQSYASISVGYIFISLDYIPRNKISGTYGILCVNFWGTLDCFLKCFHNFTFLLAAYKGYNFSTFLLSLVFINHFADCSTTYEEKEKYVKFLSMIVFTTFSAFSSFNFCFTYLEAILLEPYKFRIVIILGRIALFVSLYH